MDVNMQKVLHSSNVDAVKATTEGKHLCTLPKEVWNPQGKLPRLAKIWTASDKNPKTSMLLRTKCEILLEKRRHMDSRFYYILHPFSIFQFYWSIALVTTYMMSLLLIPLSILTNLINKKCSNHWETIVLLLVDIQGFLDIILTCFTGYVNYKMMKIELNQWNIMQNYVKSAQFYVDIVTWFPIHCLCQFLPLETWYTILMLSIFKTLRLKKILHIVIRCSAILWSNIAAFNLILFAMIVLLWIHWMACILPAVPLYHARIEGTPLKNDSWILIEGADPNKLGSVYLNAYFWATAMFLCVRHASEGFDTPIEVTITIMSYLLGYVSCAILFVLVLQLVISFGCKAIKLEAITNQLSKYMTYRRLSINLQEKMLSYYEYKFRTTYYREGKLMSILSDQLRKELNFFRYVSLVKSVNVLHHVSDDAVQQIVLNLKQELFLPNDVIIKAGTEGECMYFLAMGTVAVYTPMGREICHYTDGSYFGEVELLRKDTKRITSVIAIETCEVYRLDRKDFKNSLANEPETYKYLERIALERVTNAAFLEELHKKHILERNMAVTYNL